MPGFLETVATSAATNLANRAISGLFDPSPGEQNRQAISNTNNFLRGTVGTRAAADQQYMDTVYAGTSPWERLGSSASAPIPTQDAGTSREAAMMPLMTARLQADTQQRVAQTQQETAENVARINQETQLATNHQSTAGGQLPLNQAALSAAQAVTEAARQANIKTDTTLKEYQTHKTDMEAQNIYQSTLINRVKTFFEMAPKETLDLGAYKVTQTPGWQTIAKWFESKDTGTSNLSFDGLVKQMPKDQFAQVVRDIAQIAGAATTTGRAASNFLGGIAMGKHSISRIFKK